MPYTLYLENDDKSLKVALAPNHGGTIYQISFHGKEILRCDAGAFEYAPMAGGGNPLLFPFASKTKDDHYLHSGKDYYMPMHGLVKNMPFALRSISKDRAVLGVGSSPNWKLTSYPFDFDMEVEYRVVKNAVEFIVRLTNLSSEPLPHSLGWHPFFYCSDKKRARLSHNADAHYDYVACRMDELPVVDHLTEGWDDVFMSSEPIRFKLENEADGYIAEMVSDDAFKVMVLCTNVPDSICAEPWCGIPDSINNGNRLQFVNPSETKEFRSVLYLSEM